MKIPAFSSVLHKRLCTGTSTFLYPGQQTTSNKPQQLGIQPDSCCNMQPSRIITDYNRTQFHIYVHIYIVKAGSLRIAPDIHAVIKLVKVTVTRVLHYVSSTYGVSTTFTVQ